MRVLLLLIWMSEVIAASAFADGLKEYALHIPLASHEVCQTMAENMDKAPGEGNVFLSLHCKGSVLSGTISAARDRTSANLRIVWPNDINRGCEQVSQDLQSANIKTTVSCKTVTKPTYFPQWMMKSMSQWTATFSLPLTGGRDIEQIQAEKKAVLHKIDDEDICNDPARIEEARKKGQCAYAASSQMTDETGERKPTQTTRGSNPKNSERTQATGLGGE